MTVLSSSLEDYLEAIAELIALEGHAHTKDIAQRLKVKMPSVTGALRQLAALNYIEYDSHFPVRLTAAGAAAAQKIIRRHRVLEIFFRDILGLAPERAQVAACEVEHHVDEDAIDRLAIFSNAIAGRSDSRELCIHLTEAMENLADDERDQFCVLAELSAGEQASVDRFSRNLTSAPPLSPGQRVVMEMLALDRNSVRIQADGKTLTIAVAEAENIWVKRIRPMR